MFSDYATVGRMLLITWLGEIHFPKMMGIGRNEENNEEGVITCLHAIESEVLLGFAKSKCMSCEVN